MPDPEETVPEEDTGKKKGDKLPAFQFYPGDWRKDPGIQAMDYEERGVWFELLLIMQESENRGMLTLGNLPIKTARLGRLLGISEKKTKKFLQNFLEIRVARVCPLTGVIYNKRMMRTEQIRQSKIRAGRAGKGKSGNPQFKKGQPNPYADDNAELNAEGNAKDKSKGGSSSSFSSSTHYPLTPTSGGTGKMDETTPPNSRAHGTNRRAIDAREKHEAEKLAKLESQIDREVDDAWDEIHQMTPEETKEAIRQAKIKSGWRVPIDDEVVI